MTAPQFESGVTLILGGSRSGKSEFAERLGCSSNRPLVYLATGEAIDSEMSSRIEEHKNRRGTDWELAEERVRIVDILKTKKSSCVLVDSLSYWVWNLLNDKIDFFDATKELTDFLTSSSSSSECGILLVSDDVSGGIIPADSLSRDFRDKVGILNQSVAAVSSSVWYCVAGLPQRLK